MRRVSMVLVLALPLVFLGCSGTPPTITPSAEGADAGAVPTLDPNAEDITVEIMNTQIAVGLERIAFRLVDVVGASISTNATVDVSFSRVEQVAEGQTMAQKVASGEAVFFGERMPGGGAWVVYHDFDSSGLWQLEVTAVHDTGWVGTGRAPVEVLGRIDTPRLGDRPSMVDTPTVSEQAGLADVTSDPAPVQALYEMSVADAIASDLPTVVLFASPAYSGNAACEATLVEMKAELATRGSQVNFIHVESRDLADPTQMSAAAKAWALPSEPWTFVLDRQGFVSARIEGPLDRLELDLLLDRELGG